MNNHYLQELIDETIQRGGGLILNYNDKPAVVVLTVEKYNQLLSPPGEQPQGFLAQNEVFQENNLFMETPSLNQTILVTGGAGYIGAHVSRQLIKEGYRVVVLDNLSTGKKENIANGAKFIEGDLADINLVRDLFASNKFFAVVHMAASVEVEESVLEPFKYLENNSLNTEKLLRVMNEFGVKKLIFSSTAAIYGEQKNVPISENSPLRPQNPYGYSKLLAEKFIKFHTQFNGLEAFIFRYFNACGCDFSADIQATHESHLLPIVLGVAAGLKKQIVVNGGDYDTPDGSCIRDYVHVLDIAKAHALALKNFSNKPGLNVYNIGTGQGQSVLEIVKAVAEELNRMVPMEMGPRRAGDSAILVADNSKIKRELGFELQYSDIKTIIETAWDQYKKANI